jgi:hypothetical protein
MNYLDNFIYTNPFSISKEVCEDIIENYENEKENRYEGVTGGGLNKDIKDTLDFVIPKNNEKWYNVHYLLEKELNNNIKKYQQKLNDKKLFNYTNKKQNTGRQFKILDYSKFLSPNFMIQRYTKQKGRYTYHNDFRINWNEKKYRAVNFLWYLNSVDEGGETEFWGNYKIKPEAGKLVLFPACWTFPHAGKMPISQDKYIITGWLYVDE